MHRFSKAQVIGKLVMCCLIVFAAAMSLTVDNPALGAEYPALDRLIGRLACEARVQSAVETCKRINDFTCAPLSVMWLGDACISELNETCEAAGQYATEVCSNDYPAPKQAVKRESTSAGDLVINSVCRNNGWAFVVHPRNRDIIGREEKAMEQRRTERPHGRGKLGHRAHAFAAAADA